VVPNALDSLNAMSQVIALCSLTIAETALRDTPRLEARSTIFYIQRLDVVFQQNPSRMDRRSFLQAHRLSGFSIELKGPT
jgi:hypothetical protein